MNMNIHLDYRAGNPLSSVTAAADLDMKTISHFYFPGGGLVLGDEKLCRKQNMGK